MLKIKYVLTYIIFLIINILIWLTVLAHIIYLNFISQFSEGLLNRFMGWFQLFTRL